MRIASFSNTCTARIMYGFGQSATALTGRGVIDKDTMFNKCRELLQQAGREGAATVIAIIDNQQTIAAEVLPQLGFVCVQRDLAKHKHPEKKISTYVYTVCDADRVALAVPVNPWESPEARRAREAAAAAEAARAAEAVRVAEEERRLRAERERSLADIRRNDVDYNRLPAPHGRNRDLEATSLYQSLKVRLAHDADTWKKCRRNLRVLFEQLPWTFSQGAHLDARARWQGSQANDLNLAFAWEHTPQGDRFWANINNSCAE